MLKTAQSTFVYRLLHASITEYGARRVSRMAAAVAYRTLFALAPVFIISVGVLGRVLGSDAEAEDRIYEGIESVLGVDVANAFRTLLDTALSGSGTATAVGLALLLWTASSLFYEIRNNLDDIFHVPYGKTSGVVEFIKKRGWGFLWALGLGMTVLAVWLANVVWQYLDGTFAGLGLEPLHAVLDWLTPLVSLVFLPVLLGLLYQTMTDVKISRRAVMRGGMLVAFLFVLTAAAAESYFAWSDDTSAATVAGALFVIIFLAYLLSSVFLLGGVVMKVYEDFLQHGDVMAPSERRRREIEAALVADAVVAQPVPPVPAGAVSGFLAGLFVGWRRSRR